MTTQQVISSVQHATRDRYIKRLALPSDRAARIASIAVAVLLVVGIACALGLAWFVTGAM